MQEENDSWLEYVGCSVFIIAMMGCSVLLLALGAFAWIMAQIVLLFY